MTTRPPLPGTTRTRLPGTTRFARRAATDFLVPGVLVVLGLACSKDSEADTSAAGRGPRAATRPPVVRAEVPPWTPRVHDAAAVAAGLALERGDLESARRLLATLPAGLDAELLAARLATLEGSQIAAIRALEDARRRFPDEARVWATAAELHAWAGREESAETEMREALARFGTTPEIARARGVLMICREGGAQAGLVHLEQALAMDPDVEFVDRPLAQGHLLLASQALGRADLAAALYHAEAAYERDPADVDVRIALADARQAATDFEGAIELYEGLLADGEDVAGTLALVSQRGAMAALLAKDRERALERYLRARELGLPPEDLGWGATMIVEELERALDAGVAAYASDDFAAAEEAFRRAARLAPEDLAAHNHLAVVLFRLEDFEGASASWRRVLALAEQTGVELPEPVHLNLARSLYRAGEYAAVRAELNRYLDEVPAGAWVPDTRAMLERLDAEGR